MRHEFESSHESDFLTRLEKDARAHTSDHGHPILISSRILTHRGRATLMSTTMAKGRAASRKSRVYIFREWLMKTYGSYLYQEIAMGDGDDCNRTSNLAFRDLSESTDTCQPRTHRKRKRSRSSSPVILDVAGGKGDLSWLLKNVDGLESIVVDPWKPDPKTTSRNERMVKSIEYLRQHPEEAQKRSVPCLPTYQPLAGLLPRLLEGRKKRLGLRKQQDDKLQHSSDDKNPNFSSSTKTINVSNQECNKGSTRDGEDDSCRPEDFLTPQIFHVPLDENLVQRVHKRVAQDIKEPKISKSVDETISTDDSTNENGEKIDPEEMHAEGGILDLLTSGRIKLIVGFHPDQATEPCIDLARVLGIPYCVVPCCVFPSEFPDRRVRQSAVARNKNNANDKSIDAEDQETMVPVRTYQQFLDYLRAKATAPLSEIVCEPCHEEDEQQRKVLTSYLDFPFTETAKNIVLYTLPPSA